MRDYAGDEIAPGADIQSDEALDDFVKDAVESAYHPCGTCRMGAADDGLAVVDPTCRVIGVDGLRVADSSIFPRLTNGNLNGPSLMVGEKAADHILAATRSRRPTTCPGFTPTGRTGNAEIAGAKHRNAKKRVSTALVQIIHE